MSLVLVGACGRPASGIDDGETGTGESGESGTGTDTGGCEDALDLVPEAPGPLSFESMWTDGEQIVAVGARHLTSFDGSEWSTERLDELDPYTAIDVWATATDDAYVITDRSIAHWNGADLDLQYTEDDGVDERIDAFDSIWGASPNEIWAVGRSLECYDCPDLALAFLGPDDWMGVSPVSEARLSSVHAADGRVITAGTEAWMREGGTWTQWPAPPMTARLAWTADGADTWVAGSFELEAAHGGAAGWESFDLSADAPGDGAQVVGLWGRASDDVYLALANQAVARVLRWNGSEWAVFQDLDHGVELSGDGHRRLMTSDGDILLAAIGEGAEIWRLDGSQSARAYASGAVPRPLDMYGLPDGSVLTVGTFGLHGRVDGEWTRVMGLPELEYRWQQVAATSTSDVYLVGHDVLLSHWDGQTLTPFDDVPYADQEPELEDMWVGSDGLWVTATIFGVDETITRAVLHRVDGAWDSFEIGGPDTGTPRLVGVESAPWVIATTEAWRWDGNGFVAVDLGVDDVRWASMGADEELWLAAPEGVGRFVDGAVEWAELPAHQWSSVAVAGAEVWAIGRTDDEQERLVAAHFDGQTWTDTEFDLQLSWIEQTIAMVDGAVFFGNEGPVLLEDGCE